MTSFLIILFHLLYDELDNSYRLFFQFWEIILLRKDPFSFLVNFSNYLGIQYLLLLTFKVVIFVFINATAIYLSTYLLNLRFTFFYFHQYEEQNLSERDQQIVSFFKI